VRPAFAPDGASLAATVHAKGENLLVAWRAEDGTELFRPPLAAPHTRATYSPDGQTLVTGGYVGGAFRVETFDARTGQPGGSWSPGAALRWWDVVCGPNGLVAVSTMGDRPVVKLFQLADGREGVSLEGNVNAVTALAFSPDGRRLVTAGGDFTVRLWDTETGRELLTFREHTELPDAVAWSPDGRRIGSAGHDFKFNVWEARPAETAPRTDDWPPLIHDTFATDGDLGAWQPARGSPWEVRGGALHGRQVQVTLGGPPFPYAGALRSDLKLPRTAEVRFAYRAERPLTMAVHLATRPDGQRGYTALLCGDTTLFGRPCARLQRVTEGWKVSFIGVEGAFAMRPPPWRNVRVLRQPERIRVYVDGAETLSAPIQDVELPYLSLAGLFGAVGDEIEFNDVEVRAPAGDGR
jgi:hypothetical protein